MPRPLNWNPETGGLKENYLDPILESPIVKIARLPIDLLNVPGQGLGMLTETIGSALTGRENRLSFTPEGAAALQRGTLPFLGKVLTGRAISTPTVGQQAMEGYKGTARALQGNYDITQAGGMSPEEELASRRAAGLGGAIQTGLEAAGTLAMDIATDPINFAWMKAGQKANEASQLLAKAITPLEKSQAVAAQAAANFAGAEARLKQAQAAQELSQQVQQYQRMNKVLGAASLPGMAAMGLESGVAATEAAQNQGMVSPEFAQSLVGAGMGALGTAGTIHDIGRRPSPLPAQLAEATPAVGAPDVMLRRAFPEATNVTPTGVDIGGQKIGYGIEELPQVLPEQAMGRAGVAHAAYSPGQIKVDPRVAQFQDIAHETVHAWWEGLDNQKRNAIVNSPKTQQLIESLGIEHENPTLRAEEALATAYPDIWQSGQTPEKAFGHLAEEAVAGVEPVSQPGLQPVMASVRPEENDALLRAWKPVSTRRDGLTTVAIPELWKEYKKQNPDSTETEFLTLLHNTARSSAPTAAITAHDNPAALPNEVKTFLTPLQQQSKSKYDAPDVPYYWAPYLDKYSVRPESETPFQRHLREINEKQAEELAQPLPKYDVGIRGPGKLQEQINRLDAERETAKAKGLVSSRAPYPGDEGAMLWAKDETNPQFYDEVSAMAPEERDQHLRQIWKTSGPLEWKEPEKLSVRPNEIKQQEWDTLTSEERQRKSDVLLGKGPERPGFAVEKYPHTEYVRVSYPDGLTWIDAQKGLNQGHALARARANWDGAKIEPVTKAEFDADTARQEGEKYAVETKYSIRPTEPQPKPDLSEDTTIWTRLSSSGRIDENLIDSKARESSVQKVVDEYGWDAINRALGSEQEPYKDIKKLSRYANRSWNDWGFHDETIKETKYSVRPTNIPPLEDRLSWVAKEFSPALAEEISAYPKAKRNKVLAKLWEGYGPEAKPTGDTLRAYHSLDSYKLEEALKRGGMPMPSFEITNKPTPGFDNDITFIAKKKTVDPAVPGNYAYRGDAATGMVGGLASKQGKIDPDFLAKVEAEANTPRGSGSGIVRALAEGRTDLYALTDPYGRSTLTPKEQTRLLELRRQRIDEGAVFTPAIHQEYTQLESKVRDATNSGENQLKYKAWLKEKGLTQAAAAKAIEPVSAETIAEEMKSYKAHLAGTYGSTTGVQARQRGLGLKATLMKPLKSIAEMHEAEKEIGSRAFPPVPGIQEVVNGVTARLLKYPISQRERAVRDILTFQVEKFAEQQKKEGYPYYTVSEIKAELDRTNDPAYLKSVVKYANDVEAEKIPFIEGKAARAVKFDEMAGAVVGPEVKPELVQSLEAAGVPVTKTGSTLGSAALNARYHELAEKQIQQGSLTKAELAEFDNLYSQRKYVTKEQALRQLESQAEARGEKVRFSVRPDQDELGFFSQLKRTVEGLPSSMKASDLSNYLRDPKRGVKAAEMKWTGMDDWLKEQGGKKLTKEEVQKFVEEHQVRLEEIKLGSNQTPEEQARMRELVFKEKLTDKEIEELRILDKKADAPDTKFSSPEWQEPGGTNYREFLLTLPPVSGKPSLTAKETSPGVWEVSTETGRTSTFKQKESIAPLTEELVLQMAANRFKMAAWDTTTNRYTGGHYAEPVVVHFRTKDRVTPDGKKVLFVEEVQSDWGQKGREKGFGSIDPQRWKELSEKAGNRTPAEQAEFEELNVKDEAGLVPPAPFVSKTEFAVFKEGKELSGEFLSAQRNVESTKQAVQRTKSTHPGWQKLNDAYKQAEFDLQALPESKQFNGEKFEGTRQRYGTPEEAQAAAKIVGGEVHDMGMQEDTAGFSNLALKRIIRKAAEEGYDKVAWTTGEMQQERYNLAKHYKEVIVERAGNKLEVRATPIHAQTSERLGYFAPDKLSEAVGKDLATKITEDLKAQPTSASDTILAELFESPEWKNRFVPGPSLEPMPTLEEWIGKVLGPKKRRIYENAPEPNNTLRYSGLDLKVGGEGMTAYYDQMLPNFANKLGKKFGSQVKLEDAGLSKPVPTLDITPQMKQSVMEEGQQKFSVRPESTQFSTLDSSQLKDEYTSLRDQIKSVGLTPEEKSQLKSKYREIRAEGHQRGHWWAAPKELRPVRNLIARQQGLTEDTRQALYDELSKPAYQKTLLRATPVKAAQISDEVLAKMAKLNGLSVKEMTAKVNKHRGLVADIIKMDNIANTASMEAQAAQTKINSMSGPEKEKAYLELIRAKALTETMHEAQANALDMRTTVGRALAMYRWASTSPITSEASLLAALRNTFRGLGKSEEEAKQLASDWYKLPSDELAMKLRKMNWWDNKANIAMEIWRANLLTGPATHVANVGGSVLNAMMTIGKTPFAAGWDALTSKMTGKERQRYAGEAGAQLNGVFRSLPGAVSGFFKEALDAVQLKPELHESKILGGEFQTTGVTPGKAGRFVRLPFRMLGAADDAWKKVFASMDLNSVAYRNAKKSGITPSAWMEQYNANISRRSHKLPGGVTIGEVQDSTLRAANIGTFQEELTPGWNKVVGVVHGNKALQLFFPFLKTPINIGRMTVRMSPLGAIQMFAQKKNLSRGEMADRAGMMMAGMGLMTLIGGMKKAGLLEITGSGPVDKDERKAKLATGWQPNSIKIGPNYYSYSRLEPVAGLVGMTADWLESKDEVKQRDYFTKIISTFIDNMKAKNYLQGLSNLSAILNDPVGEVANSMKNIVASGVPAAVAVLERANDPYFRESQGLVQGVQARIPGLAEELPAKMGVTGEKVERPGTFLSRLLSPVAVSKEIENADVERELSRLRMPLKPPSRDFRLPDKTVRRLDEDEFSILVDSYKKAADQIRRLLSHPTYQSLPDTIAEGGENSKEYLINQIYAQRRAKARNTLYAYLRINRKRGRRG